MIDSIYEASVPRFLPRFQRPRRFFATTSACRQTWLRSLYAASGGSTGLVSGHGLSVRGSHYATVMPADRKALSGLARHAERAIFIGLCDAERIEIVTRLTVSPAAEPMPQRFA
jgi:hypothetical protein